MDSRNISKELVCFDAYTILRRGARDTLAALESDQSEDAGEILHRALTLSESVFAKCADDCLFGVK